jgi:hypothetical protein
MRLGIRRTSYKPWNPTTTEKQWKYWFFCCVRIAASLVTVLSLGYLVADWDTRILMSDWMER